MRAEWQAIITARVLVDGATGCWNWTIGKDKNGYGKAKIAQRSLQAHRAAWCAFRCEIPEGMLVCHSCDNPSCANPDHLFLGSPQANMDDKMAKGRWRGGPACWARRHLGAGHHKAKLNPDKVREMRALFGVKPPSEIARAFGVCNAAVAAVKGGKTWAHVQ